MGDVTPINKNETPRENLGGLFEKEPGKESLGKHSYPYDNEELGRANCSCFDEEDCPKHAPRAYSYYESKHRREMLTPRS